MSTPSTSKETAAARLARLRAKRAEEERQAQEELEALEKEAALEAKTRGGEKESG